MKSENARQPLVKRYEVELEHVARMQIDAHQLQFAAAAEEVAGVMVLTLVLTADLSVGLGLQVPDRPASCRWRWASSSPSRWSSFAALMLSATATRRWTSRSSGRGSARRRCRWYSRCSSLRCRRTARAPGCCSGSCSCSTLAMLAVSLGRREDGHTMHALGAVATLLVFAIWLAMSHSSSAWITVTVFATVCGAFYALAPMVATLIGRPLTGAGATAVYAAPLVLFVFPVIARIEPRGRRAARAVRRDVRAAGADRVARPGDRESGLVLRRRVLRGRCRGLVVRDVSDARAPARRDRPVRRVRRLLSRRASRQPPPRPRPRAGVGSGRRADRQPRSCCCSWRRARARLRRSGVSRLLLAILEAGVFIESAAGDLPMLSAVGALLSWLVLGVWWNRAAAVVGLLPSLLAVIGLTLIMLVGHAWAHAQIRRRIGEAATATDGFRHGIYLALVGHFFLFYRRPGSALVHAAVAAARLARRADAGDQRVVARRVGRRAARRRRDRRRDRRAGVGAASRRAPRRPSCSSPLKR